MVFEALFQFHVYVTVTTISIRCYIAKKFVVFLYLLTSLKKKKIGRTRCNPIASLLSEKKLIVEPQYSVCTQFVCMYGYAPYISCIG